MTQAIMLESGNKVSWLAEYLYLFHYNMYDTYTCSQEIRARIWPRVCGINSIAVREKEAVEKELEWKIHLNRPSNFRVN